MTADLAAASGSETRKKIDHVPLSLKESRRLGPKKNAPDVLRLTHFKAGSWPRAYLLLEAGNCNTSGIMTSVYVNSKTIRDFVIYILSTGVHRTSAGKWQGGVLVRLDKHFSLEDFDFDSKRGLCTGLSLLAALLPRGGVVLTLTQRASNFETLLELSSRQSL